MKVQLIIYSFLLIGITCLSQTPYYPLVDTGKTWHVMESVFPGNTLTYTYKCDGDTTIENDTYKILHMSDQEFPADWTRIGFIREDANRKVYYLPKDGMIEPAMVYDFNVQTGDTLTITSFIQSYPQDVEIVITNTDSVMISGDYRKKIEFACEYYDQNFWIEGIGSNNGLLETGFYCYIVCPMVELLCVQSQGELIYQHDYFDECYIVGEDENHAVQNVLRVFPNPASEKVYIRPVQNVKTNSIFILLNSTGQVINRREVSNSETFEIDLSDHPAGLYFYIFRQGNVNAQTDRLLIR